MATGIIGHTGFIGGNIVRQRPVDRAYHRPNICQIRGERFDTLWISGAPAQKWVANADPEADEQALAVLADHLRHVEASTVVLVSTVDVYPQPVDVDESTQVSPDDHAQAYGRNRLAFEQRVQERFARTLVLRLPGLFGPGLKKNLVYDLLNERDEFAHRDSSFQFYDLTRLCDDVDVALRSGLDLLNLATEPTAAREVAEQVFGRELRRVEGVPARYDVRTRHAGLFGAPSEVPYVMDRPDVLRALRAFVQAERP